MRLILAEYAGFCFGVRRAIEAVNKHLEKGEQLCTFGPIIHNPQVVSDLEKRGATVINSVAEAGDKLVVIRSHGVSPDVLKAFEDAGVTLLDATCPFVKRIHETVARCHLEGWPVLIVGARDHPEVAGIYGWAVDNVYVLSSPEDVDALPKLDRACIVAQTTITQQIWESTLARVRERISELQAYNTICSTTSERQQEAIRIAKQSDVLLVIGGKNSANTKKLFELGRQYCPSTYAIETIDEIPILSIPKDGVVGILAGASTPDWIIKEVVTTMTELDNNEINPEIANDEPAVSIPESTDSQQEISPAVIEQETVPAVVEVDENDFAATYEKTLVTIRTGQIVKGIVVQIAADEVCVNIGFKSDGYIAKSELSTDPDVVISDIVKVGEEIEVEVLKLNDGQGNVQLSKKRVDARKSWSAFMRNAKDGDRYLEVVGKKVIKGGLLAYADDTQVFIPASHLATRYVEHIESFLNKPMMVKVLEVDDDKKRIVASRKQALIEEAAHKKDEVWGKIVVGETIQGTVRRLTDFGAFVDLGGVDGLIHISDLSWNRTRHPSDVLKVNDVVDVLVLSAELEKDRISLGYKQLKPKPWDLVEEKYPVGTIVKGTVARLVSFGAFVELEPGIDGLVHISQVARRRIEKVEDVLKPGQVVDVKVLGIDKTRERISLSIREALPPEEITTDAADDEINFTVPEIDEIPNVTIGDILESQNKDVSTEE